MMTHAAPLDGILGKTETVIARVRPPQRGLGTPCSDWDVAELERHMVGWLRFFAAALNDREEREDAGAYRLDDDPAAAFHAAAEDALAGLRAGGEDRKVRLLGGEVPVSMVRSMMVGEYLVHGWDLATETGQPVPYTEEEAEAAMALRAMLTPENRGSSFAPEVPAPQGASVLTRLIAFSGRTPVGTDAR
jgi:uncharacterized protein (TIGR03086 family)